MIVTQENTALANTIGQQVRKAREARGLTLEELADQVNISVEWLGSVEHGLTLPSMLGFARLVAVLETSADALLGKPLDEPTLEGGGKRDEGPLQLDRQLAIGLVSELRNALVPMMIAGKYAAEMPLDPASVQQAAKRGLGAAQVLHDLLAGKSPTWPSTTDESPVPVEIDVSIKCDIGCDTGGYYVEWCRDDGKIQRWYGSRIACLNRGTKPPDPDAWVEPAEGASGDAATRSGMYDQS